MRDKQKNIVASIFNVVLSAIQSLWLLSYIQRKMGVDAYGYIAVVTGIVNMANIVTLAFTTFTSRFVTVSLHRKKLEEANKYFNSALSGLAAISVFLSLAFTVLLIFLRSWMKVDAEYVGQVRMLLFLVSGSFIFNALSTPMKAGVYYRDKVYIMHGLQILSYLARIISAAALYELFDARLWFAYLGSFVVDFFALLFYLFIYQKLMPGIKIRRDYFDLVKMKEILLSGVWVSINKAGASLLTTMNTYLTNIILTAVVTGIYSTVSQFVAFVGMFTMAVISVLVPSIYRLYAVNEWESLEKYTVKCSRIIGISVGFITGGLMIYEEILLSLMIEEIYIEYSFLIFLILFELPLTYEANVLEQVLISFNKFTLPAISQLVTGVVNLIMILTIYKLFGASIYTIAVVTAFVSICRNLIFLPVYHCKVTSFKLMPYYLQILRGVTACALTVLVGYVIRTILKPCTMISFACAVFMTALIALAIIYFLLLPADERKASKKLLSGLLGRNK